LKVLIVTAYFREECRSIPSSYKLAKLLSDNNIQTIVLTSKAKSKRMFSENKYLKVIETKDIFFKDPINLNIMPFLPFKLIKLLLKEKPDVTIISKYIFFPILMVPLLKMLFKRTYVLVDTYPGVGWNTNNKTLNFLASIYTKWFAKYLLRMSNKVILTHEEIVNTTMDLGIKRFEVIHNGVDIGKYEIANNDEKTIHIAYVGRMANVKGVELLERAANQIIKEGYDVMFYFAGEPSKKNKPKMNYTGFIDNIPSFLSTMDIFVMPSYAEGLPSAVVEAMAAGLPIIGSDIDGGMKFLVQNNITGLTFKRGDYKDLKNKLLVLIEDAEYRKHLGRNARKFAEQQFDNKIILEDWKRCIMNKA